MTDIDLYSEKIFEDIKHYTEEGIEFWYARELQGVLEYTQWRNFLKVIDKAKEACENAQQSTPYLFADVGKMIQLAKGAEREIEDMMLSRYACYLIVMNGDPRKEVIALGQTYFAIKTRQQELIEHYEELSEDQKRLAIRKEMKEHNKRLSQAAKDAGVKTTMDYAIFQNYGYQGLYGGLKAKDIHERKGLQKNQHILDHMDYEELAANLFRATQTEAKLRRDKVEQKAAANQTHYEVGKKVRQTIADLGGTMPEDLPVPEKSIKQIEKEQKQLQST